MRGRERDRVAASAEEDLVSTTVCLSARTLGYTTGGGHLWVYLNWALGLRALGCRVIWMETVMPDLPAHEVGPDVAALKGRLEPYGLAESVALCSFTDEPLPPDTVGECLDIEAAAEADLLLDLEYLIAPKLVGRFRRTALVDIDPGLMQVWLSKGLINLARHDVYFTTGETVGQPGSRIPDAGVQWHYTPPCVALEWWPPHRPGSDAAFTTVSHWAMDEWEEDADGLYSNDKRTGFLPFLGLPQRTSQPLELALCLSPHEEDERVALQKRGWRVRHSYDVAPTPWDYQHYIQDSLGEFSCVKPSCIRLQNAWVSDRTLCYLASGKPAVVEHTGPSRFLPDAAGLFRFRDVAEAERCLETVTTDYERQCELARALAEDFFDAKKVVSTVLERAVA
jgi:hypothetical protein